MNSEQRDFPVPERRAYRSSLRADRAALTRRTLLTAAAECFAQRGYAGTSLKEIADRAGVSVETVQLNGPKADLMLAAFEQAFAGEEGRDSLLERDAFRPILALTDPDEVVRALVRFMVPANIASADLAAAFEAAALSDARIAQARDELGKRARADALAGTRFVASLGGVTSGRPLLEVAEELWFVTRSAHYLYLCREAGWTAEQYAAWLQRSMAQLLL
jgi:AcrR family transcriptional regulator